MSPHICLCLVLSYIFFQLTSTKELDEGRMSCGGDWQFTSYVLDPESIDWDYPPLEPETKNLQSKFETFLSQEAERNTPKRGPSNITLIYNETLLAHPKYDGLKATLDAAKKVWENAIDDNLQLEVRIELVNETQPYLGVTSSILILLPFSIVQYAHKNKNINKNEVWSSFKNTLKFHELFNFPPNTLWNDQLTVTPAELLLLWGRSTYETYQLDDDPTTIHINDRFLSSFDLDPYDPTPSNLYDLYSVLVHEFGHVFGFGSGMDVIDFGVYENGTTGPYPLFCLDLFRFTSESETDLVKGIRQADPANFSHWYSDATNHVELSSGSFSGQNQASHWAQTNSSKLTYGMMTPVLYRGKQIGFSPNDISAFSHLGYHLNTLVPQLQSYFLDKEFLNVTVQGHWIESSKKVVCRFNQDDATIQKPMDLVSETRWRDVSCKIPKSLRVPNSKMTVQLSNDKGKTWSNKLTVWIEPLPVLTNWTYNTKKNQVILNGFNFSSSAYCEFLYTQRIKGSTNKDGTTVRCNLEGSTISLSDPEARVRVWQHTQGSDWLFLNQQPTSTTTTSSGTSSTGTSTSSSSGGPAPTSRNNK